MLDQEPDGRRDSQWQNRLDLREIPAPEGEWTNPQPYWGADGFVVIRWDRKDKKQIYIALYEWLGRWVEIQYWSAPDVPTFDVHDTSDEFVMIATGAGKFLLVRTDQTSNYGAIALFTRDLYLPGRWSVSYFLAGQEIASGHGTKHHVASAQIGIGDRIAGVLDLVKGALYLYELGADGVWRAYAEDVIEIPPVEDGVGSAMFVATQTPTMAFTIGSTTTTHRMASSPARSRRSGKGTASSTSWTAGDNFIVQLSLSQGSGFALLFAHLEYNVSLDLYRPLAISWDDALESVNLQKIRRVDPDWPLGDWGVPTTGILQSDPRSAATDASPGTQPRGLRGSVTAG